MHKPFKTLFLIGTIIISLFFGCSKDDADDSSNNGTIPNQEPTLTKQEISGKWIVSNSNDFISFEFSESGNYIVVQDTATKSIEWQEVIFGTFQIANNRTVVLSEYGTIKITALTNDTISFGLTIEETTNEISINATKATEIEITDKTELLCKTWELITLNGESVVGTEYDLSVMFSAAGTYLVNYSDGNNGLAEWIWKDSEEEYFCYSWTGDPNCDGNNEVEVSELTNTDLTIIEGEYIFVFQLAASSKSPDLKSIKLLSTKNIKHGFLKK